ncbi:hypothetical protein PVAP13_3NG258097 [Panicum virgatum]|uniref:Uncharacterized protein n=1 Tax=Panicum virgatum TaxID=38727 RepID=A0A8T0UAG3_PANVG|nr:hypothetical protein PVAP13_3NG258097 [Panicum virgatum]
MGSRGGSGGNASSWLRLVSACLALCLLLSRLSPCEGRKLLAAGEEGGKAMYLEGDLVLRTPPSPSTGRVALEAPAAVRSGFSAGGRAARLMRSVPSPGVGH